MVRTQVSFDPAFYRAARRFARTQGVSFAELCRRALARAMASERHDEPWMELSGCVRSGDPDASASVDDVVYGRPTP